MPEFAYLSSSTWFIEFTIKQLNECFRQSCEKTSFCSIKAYLSNLSWINDSAPCFQAVELVTSRLGKRVLLLVLVAFWGLQIAFITDCKTGLFRQTDRDLLSIAKLWKVAFWTCRCSVFINRWKSKMILMDLGGKIWRKVIQGRLTQVQRHTCSHENIMHKLPYSSLDNLSVLLFPHSSQNDPLCGSEATSNWKWKQKLGLVSRPKRFSWFEGLLHLNLRSLWRMYKEALKAMRLFPLDTIPLHIRTGECCKMVS